MLIEMNSFESEATADEINSLREKISHRLSRFENHLTRVVAYFEDTNGPTRQGIDKRCKLEARLKSQSTPVVASAEGVSEERALHDAAEKLVALLTRIVDQLKEHRQNVI